MGRKPRGLRRAAQPRGAQDVPDFVGPGRFLALKRHAVGAAGKRLGQIEPQAAAG
jgi:hypothetical protein